MDKNIELNNEQNKDDDSALAQKLKLTKSDVEDILVSEFGKSIKDSKGYDDLVQTLIN